MQLLERLGVMQGTILDFGAGTGLFAYEIEVRAGVGRYLTRNYEPSVAGQDEFPDGEQFDAVVCTHVLEHVEPHLLAGTLAQIVRAAKRAIYVEVPHGPANRKLADGRDAHLIQEPHTYWWTQLTIAADPAEWDLWPHKGQNPLNTVYVLVKKPVS